MTVTLKTESIELTSVSLQANELETIETMHGYSGAIHDVAAVLEPMRVGNPDI